jgi:hypothetical protein
MQLLGMWSNVLFVSLFFYRPDEIVTPKDDPIVQEISDVLKEWNLMWKRLYAVSLITYMYMYTVYMAKEGFIRGRGMP